MKMKVLCVCALIWGFLSCRSMPDPFLETRSWSVGENSGTFPTLGILPILVERNGVQAALTGTLEQEIAAMVPLIFLEEGYYFCPGRGEADYVAEVRAREREYTQGWRMKSSLVLEIRLWQGRGEDPRLYQDIPLAAAQVIARGNKTFSSSRQLNRMLYRGIKKSLQILRQENAGKKKDGTS